MRHIILGSGVAGVEAALAIRARSEEARVTIVSSEHEHFFSRPALMYVLAGQLALRDIQPYDSGLFERMRFERVGKTVLSVSLEKKALFLADHTHLEYDRLLLACGSKPRQAPWPGSEGPGVHYFVTLQDMQGLDREARPGGRAVVVGGGLIGVEVAEILHERGLHVTFIVREDWYFPLALDERESGLVSDHMRARGVDVRLGVKLWEIVRGAEGRPRAVLLENGESVPSDLVVVAIGVVPNTSFLCGSGIALSENGAIEVDTSLRTNAASVWAAGDCANVSWDDGSRRPEQLWYTARDQGRVAGRSMLGDSVTYRRGTLYNSAKFFDIEWTTVGRGPSGLGIDNRPARPEPGLLSWFQRLPGRPVSQKVVVKDDEVVGFSMLGSRWDHERLGAFIEERRSFSYVISHLHEAQFDEEFSPRFRVLDPASLEAMGSS